MMTDKLYKLVEQARNYADKIPAAGYEQRIWNNHFHSKYAELIIQECINTFEELRINLDNEVEWKNGRPLCNNYNLSQTIKKHFGFD